MCWEQEIFCRAGNRSDIRCLRICVNVEDQNVLYGITINYNEWDSCLREDQTAYSSIFTYWSPHNHFSHCVSTTDAMKSIPSNQTSIPAPLIVSRILTQRRYRQEISQVISIGEGYLFADVGEMHQSPRHHFEPSSSAFGIRAQYCELASSFNFNAVMWTSRSRRMVQPVCSL